jgi:hypothetical protein
VCPLIGIGGTHLRGEQVCFFLKEAVKAGGEARLKWYLPEHLAQEVVEAIPAAKALHGDIARQLKRASVQGSKLDGAAHARQVKAELRASTSAAASDRTGEL